MPYRQGKHNLLFDTQTSIIIENIQALQWRHKIHRKINT